MHRRMNGRDWAFEAVKASQSLLERGLEKDEYSSRLDKFWEAFTLSIVEISKSNGVVSAGLTLNSPRISNAFIVADGSLRGVDFNTLESNMSETSIGALNQFSSEIDFLFDECGQNTIDLAFCRAMHKKLHVETHDYIMTPSISMDGFELSAKVITNVFADNDLVA